MGSGEVKASLRQKLAAEVLGTFMMTATAITVDVLYYSGAHVDYVSRWLARGFIAAVVTFIFAEISGAHANPAVTIGFALRGVFSIGCTAAYLIAQFAGAIAAAALLVPLFGASLGLGASHPGSGFAPFEAAAAEAVLTFVLMIVVLTTARERPAVGKEAALAVGFTIAACGMACGPISGASMNPARTIAPEILAGQLANAWIYLSGPLAGSAVAVAAHALLHGPPTRSERKAAAGK